MFRFLKRWTNEIKESNDFSMEDLSATEILPTSSNHTMPLNSSLSVCIKPISIETATVNSPTAAPCRKSPRKLMKASVSADARSTESPTKNIKSLSNPLRRTSRETRPKYSAADQSLDSCSVLVTDALSPTTSESTNRTSTALAVVESLSNDHLPSCSNASISPDLLDSPLSRLRSFKRKVREPTNVTETKSPSKRTRLIGQSSLPSSSDVDLHELLQSSVGAPIQSSEFIGF